MRISISRRAIVELAQKRLKKFEVCSSAIVREVSSDDLLIHKSRCDNQSLPMSMNCTQFIQSSGSHQRSFLISNTYYDKASYDSATAFQEKGKRLGKSFSETETICTHLMLS